METSPQDPSTAGHWRKGPLKWILPGVIALCVAVLVWEFMTPPRPTTALPEQRSLDLLAVRFCLGNAVDAMESVLKKKTRSRKPGPVEPKPDAGCSLVVKEAHTTESGAIEIDARIAKAGVENSPSLAYADYPRVEVKIRLVPTVSPKGAVEWRREGTPPEAFPAWYLKN